MQCICCDTTHEILVLGCVLIIMYFFLQVKHFENVDYIEEETMARGAGTTASWALDRIDQISSSGDNAYNPGTGRDGSGVDIYIFDTGLKMW